MRCSNFVFKQDRRSVSAAVASFFALSVSTSMTAVSSPAAASSSSEVCGEEHLRALLGSETERREGSDQTAMLGRRGLVSFVRRVLTVAGKVGSWSLVVLHTLFASMGDSCSP